MMPLGEKAPHFELPDVISGNLLTLHSVKSETATVILFICAHCPYVKHINSGIAAVAKAYQKKGISFVAISSNDATSFPADSPAKLREQAEQYGFPFPYLYDEYQLVAKAFKAACTPDFFVFNHNLQLVYRGQFDASRPKNEVPVTGIDLTSTLDNILANRPVSTNQIPSSGCNIKWKDGVNPF